MMVSKTVFFSLVTIAVILITTTAKPTGEEEICELYFQQNTTSVTIQLRSVLVAFLKGALAECMGHVPGSNGLMIVSIRPDKNWQWVVVT